MAKYLFYPIGSTQSCRFAAEFLKSSGFDLVDHPTPEVTHLLLDVPSFGNDGQLRGGGDIRRFLEMLPRYITVVGGGLDHPALEGYRCMDLLADELYLAHNAAVTAECALQVAASELNTVFRALPVLVIGWGRIGKCLSSLLKSVGADVTVAARKITDRSILQALDFPAVDPVNLRGDYRLIFNTVPAPVLNEKDSVHFRNCVKIDLASKKGLYGDDVIWARGLPGIFASESSGHLIAEAVKRMIKEG